MFHLSMIYGYINAMDYEMTDIEIFVHCITAN